MYECTCYYRNAYFNQHTTDSNTLIHIHYNEHIGLKIVLSYRYMFVSVVAEDRWFHLILLKELVGV